MKVLCNVWVQVQALEGHVYYVSASVYVFAHVEASEGVMWATMCVCLLCVYVCS